MTVKYAARRIVLAEFDVLELDLAGQIGNVLRLEQRAGREPGAAAEAAGRLLRHSLKPAPGCIIPDAENCGPRTRRSPARYVCPFTAYEIAILAEAAAEDVRELHPFVESRALQTCPGGRSVFALAWRWLTGN
jgi:hypothetical protein